MGARRTIPLVLATHAALATIATVAPSSRADELEDAPTKERVPAIYDRDPFETKPGYGQIFATAMIGDGLRFNNPYRLRTPLGSDAESVSRTASYADVGMAITFENPLTLQHGLALRASFALEGVNQAVLTPSYLAWRRIHAFAVHGRLGVPFVLSPDLTWGFEGAAGGTWFFLGGIGLTTEIVGDFFYGAGTRDVRAASYPVLSAQIGFTATYEVLP
jgi:hypothetical protein